MHGVELLDEESELLHLGGGGVAAEPALDLGPPHVVHHDLVINIELVIDQDFHFLLHFVKQLLTVGVIFLSTAGSIIEVTIFTIGHVS